MATIQKFEDLKVSHKTRVLSQKTYLYRFQVPIHSDVRSKGQNRGSSGLIMDILAEGLGRVSRLRIYYRPEHY